MTCSINFNRNGKKVVVHYIPDEDLEELYYDDLDEAVALAIKIEEEDE